jgi:small subunit ribosomal protein S20
VLIRNLANSKNIIAIFFDELTSISYNWLLLNSKVFNPRGKMAKEEAKKTKRPTALKRNLQNKKRRMNNRVYKSRVRTAIRDFQDSLTKGDASATTMKLNEVYSILDKCAKKGVFKINRVSRTKSRLAARAVAKA